MNLCSLSQTIVRIWRWVHRNIKCEFQPFSWFTSLHLKSPIDNPPISVLYIWYSLITYWLTILDYSRVEIPHFILIILFPQSINLWCCRHVTGNGLFVLVNKCQKLESINVWGMRVPLDCYVGLVNISPALNIQPEGLLPLVRRYSTLPVFWRTLMVEWLPIKICIL